ncbi:MAG: hypothetical protein ACOCQD_02235 [archaeon]
METINGNISLDNIKLRGMLIKLIQPWNSCSDESIPPNIKEARQLLDDTEYIPNDSKRIIDLIEEVEQIYFRMTDIVWNELDAIGIDADDSALVSALKDIEQRAEKILKTEKSK